MQSQKSVLVGQWQANLSALSTIDSLIHSSESRVEETESLLRAREIEVSKAVERLQRELAALEKIERPRVSQKERELTDLKIKLSTVLRLVANQNSELGILTTAMQKGDRSLAQLRDLNSSRRRALNELENHVIPSLEHKVSILQTEIEESEENRLEEERVIDGLEDLVAAEESRLRELEEDLARVKDERGFSAPSLSMISDKRS